MELKIKVNYFYGKIYQNKMNSQDPGTWGRAAWSYLDAVVASFPVDWEPFSGENQVLYERMFNFWTFLYLPCRDCMDHYLEYIEAHPIEKAIVNQAMFLQWYENLKSFVAQNKKKIIIEEKTTTDTDITETTTEQSEPPSLSLLVKTDVNYPKIGPKFERHRFAVYDPYFGRGHVRFMTHKNPNRTNSKPIPPKAQVVVVVERDVTAEKVTKDPNRGTRGCASCGGGVGGNSTTTSATRTIVTKLSK